MQSETKSTSSSNLSAMKRLACTLLALLLVATLSSAQRPNTLDAQYRDVAGRLIGAALVDQGGWEKLTYLTTRIGNRLSGSTSLEQAVQWVFERMKSDGLENPKLQPVKVPHWVRGRESARVVAPVEKPLNILGLGSSAGTGENGVTASVVVVGSFD